LVNYVGELHQIIELRRLIFSGRWCSHEID